MGYPRFAMLDLLKLLRGLLVGLFRSHAAREVETAFIRQQLVVLKRSAPARLRLRPADRLIFVWLYRLCPSVLEAAVVFKPETLVRWHRSGFRLYWRWKSRRRVGRPAVWSAEYARAGLSLCERTRKSPAEHKYRGQLTAISVKSARTLPPLLSMTRVGKSGLNGRATEVNGNDWFQRVWAVVPPLTPIHLPEE